MRRRVLAGCLSVGSALLVPGCSGVGPMLSGSSEPESVGSCTKLTGDVDGNPPIVLLGNESGTAHDVTLRLVSRSGQNEGKLFCERTFALGTNTDGNDPSPMIRLSDDGTYEFTVELASGDSVQFEEFVGSDRSVDISIRENSTLDWAVMVVN